MGKHAAGVIESTYPIVSSQRNRVSRDLKSCWNDCLTRRNQIRPCVPSHVAYKVGAGRQQIRPKPLDNVPTLVKSGTRNREGTVYLRA